MRALVTGAAGFVGRHSTRQLVELGVEVHGAGRTERKIPGVTWHLADLLIAEERAQLVRLIRPTHLLHLAWETRHGRFWDAPENVDWAVASLDLLREFQRAGGERAVLTGSCAEYGIPLRSRTDGLLQEKETPRIPSNLYAIAKNGTHEILRAFSARVELSFAWARLFYLFGPDEHPDRLVPHVITTLLAGDQPELREWRSVLDLMDVRDTGAALAHLLMSDVAGAVNVASGEGTQIGDLLRLVADLAGVDVSTSEPPDTGPQRTVVADVSRLAAEVAFTPRFTLEQGLSDAVEWWRNKLTGEAVTGSKLTESRS